MDEIRPSSGWRLGEAVRLPTGGLTAGRVSEPAVPELPVAAAPSVVEPAAPPPTALLKGLTGFTRRGVVGLVTVGGLLAGCAVGAFTLGTAGLLMTVAVQAMAFAGGMLVSQEANRKLQHEATHDPLTGLKNRGAIMGLLTEAVAVWGGRRGPLAVVLADVDHFKSVNDTWGHPKGDAVLQEVARRLGGALRAEDAVGRYGGEEILVVLPGLGLLEARGAAERLRLELSSRPIEELDVTASFGVASSEGLDPVTAAELIRLADEALYRAKRNGRNRVETA